MDMTVCRNRGAMWNKNDTQGVTLALRGLRKRAGGEKLEEAEGLRADCGAEEGGGVELTTGGKEEDGEVVAVMGDIVMCGAGRSLS